MVLDVRAAVVDVARDARVAPRVVWVVLATEALNLRVDLDCVDVLCALGQRDGDVVAVARADDHHVVRRPAKVTVGEEVEALDPLERVDRIGRLMRDVVGADRKDAVRPHVRVRDRQRPALVDRGHLVVRRPVVVPVRGLDREHRDDRDECDGLPPPPDQ